jgi:hypothetical protein
MVDVDLELEGHTEYNTVKFAIFATEEEKGTIDQPETSIPFEFLIISVEMRRKIMSPYGWS